MIDFYVDFSIVTPNSKQHWSKEYRRNRDNKMRLMAAWRKINPKVNLPCTVSIIRVFNPSSRGKRYDEDNFIAACKGLRDSISAIIIPGLAPGRADAENLGIKFEYAQQAGDKSGFKISIRG